MKRELGVLMLILSSVLLLAACSSGGEDSSSVIETPQGSSIWDEMVWDQDDWG